MKKDSKIDLLYLNDKASILYISLFSFVIILLIFSYVINGIIKFSEFTNNKKSSEDLVLEIGYVVEYIKNEVRESEEIVEIQKPIYNQFRNNLGFILVKKNRVNSEGKYILVLYYKSGSELLRVAYTTDNYKHIDYGRFKGFNSLSKNILSIEKSKFLIDIGYIDLNIEFGSRDSRVRRREIIYIGR